MAILPKMETHNFRSRSWFKPFGWIYLPVSWQGVVVTILPLLFCVNTFIAIDRSTHSVSDTLYGIFPYWTGAFLIWLWIAEKKSQGSR